MAVAIIINFIEIVINLFVHDISTFSQYRLMDIDVFIGRLEKKSNNKWCFDPNRKENKNFIYV